LIVRRGVPVVKRASGRGTGREWRVRQPDTPSRYVGDVKVREILEELEDDGWVLARQSGSHRQFRHPTEPGTVTVPGNLADDLARGTVGSIVRQAGLPRRQR